MNHNFRRISPPHKQKGAVTLFITALIVLAMTIGSFSMVRTSNMESRMNQNDQRARQALQAAQAGVDYVVAGLASPTINRDFLCSNQTLASYGFLLSYTGPDANGAIDFDPISQKAECESLPFAVLTQTPVWSRGFSDDRESSRTILSTIDLTSAWNFNASREPVASGGGGGAIIARGNVTLGGTSQANTCLTFAQCVDAGVDGNQAKIFNAPSDTVITAGGSIDLSNRASALIGNAPNTVVTDSSISASAMSNDVFFETFVSDGESKTDFKAGSTQSLDDVDLSVNTNIWHEGDLTLNAKEIGTPQQPVTLVVTGKLTISGNSKIWGTVYVTDAEFSAGNNKIMGQLISEGNVNMTGTAAVYAYDGFKGGGQGSGTNFEQSSYQTQRTSSTRIGSWREIVN